MPDVADGFGELARGRAPLIITLETANTVIFRGMRTLFEG